MIKLGLLLMSSLISTEIHASKSHNEKDHSHKGHKHRYWDKCTEQTPTPVPQNPTQNLCEGDDLIVNGDFEDEIIEAPKNWDLFFDLTGWKISWVDPLACTTQCSSTTCRPFPVAELQNFSANLLPEMTQYTELDSDCVNPNGLKRTSVLLEQLVDANVGQKFKLSFKYRARALNQGSMKLNVVFGAYSWTFNNFIDTNWKDFSQELLIRSQDIQNSQVKLSFKDSGDPNTYGVFLGDVSLIEMIPCSGETPCSVASQVISYSPIGTIDSSRKDPSKALGLPNGEPFSENNIQFVSLGKGGSIVLKMDHTVKNVLGPDLRIFETSGGNLSFSQYPEQAQVFGSNDLSSWTSLGIVKNDNNAPELGEVDLGSMSSAKYIKIVDKTTMTGSDGFDLDAITCLNQNQNWNEDVYYVDKQSQKLYEVKVVNNEVALKMVTKTKKKVQLGYNGTNLYMVESSGKNRLRQYNPSTNTWLNLGNADVKGRLSQAVVKNNKLIVNKESKHELVEFSLPSLRQTVLGKVFHNNSQVKLINGDLAYNEMGDLHMVTQFNGGQLFKLNRSNRGFEATLVASRLGKVTGLALLPDGDMLVSLSNSKKMKKVNLQTSQVVDLKLVGDLSKQGSSADLASE
jgi:hypothetical protein